LKPTFAQILGFCTRYTWLVIVTSVLLGVLSGIYVSQHFSITTDIDKLISSDLPFRQRELALETAFPQRSDLILIVVEAPTPELASQATALLADRLSERSELLSSLREPGGGEFFRRNGLLFLPTAEVERTAHGLSEAEPLIATLVADPSLRGLSDALALGLVGVRRGQLALDDMTTTLTMAAQTIENILAGRPAYFSWRALLAGKPLEPSDLRRFIEAQAVLDFSVLEPGNAPTTAIRQAAADLKLAERFAARVRLTGLVPMADEEFATVREGAAVNTIGTLVIVLVILWLALRSGRIILAVFINLLVGLAITSALGLMMVGALNLISIAFAVLFVGLGVDFGIQYSVRYRTERHEIDDIRTALVRAGENAGAPLTLAAAATAAGFLSFLPTDYRGVSELGQIAGTGMVIAFVTSITLLPALLMVLRPRSEAEPLGYRSLAPVDRFLDRARIPVLITTGVVVVAGLPLLFHLRFDFNPINLRSPHVESVATFLDLRNDPKTGSPSINVITSSLSEAAATAPRLAALPVVGRVMTLNDFVPQDQPRKLGLIRAAAAALADALKPDTRRAPPTDAENVEALANAAEDLTQVAAAKPGKGAAAAQRLGAALSQLSKTALSVRERAQKTFVSPLNTSLAELSQLLQAQPISLEALPAELARDWVAPDGRARVQVLPNGDPNDNEILRNFARTVSAAAPNAIGGPISILEFGNVVVRAFIEAGCWALLTIAILLWIALRRLSDVLLTLVPLILAGVVTLELCVLIGLPLNFANIIALPLLLGVGVAFKIYYIMAWRAGQTNLLQTSLTRAVIFSAMTTASAFGSLWFSSHPGTSSMGKLLALSLICTLAAAVLFQPALMGRPRGAGDA